MGSDSTQPRSIGRYKVLKRLGEGAQGTVDLCLDPLWNRQVALKTLHQDQAQWMDAFRQEFEVLADLSHPRLVKVHDFGRTEEGQTFFTRDFVDGQDLMEATEGIALPDFLCLCVDICRALRPLHMADLIHGDLKPSNLVITREPTPDGPFRVWPIDFSFTRLAGGISPKRGTVPYMAPEILEGAPVDQRVDLYALGISLFEALTGQPPFTGDVNQIARAHISAVRPEVVPTRIPGSDETTNIAKGMAAIVARLINADPNARFVDLDELEAAFTALAPTSICADPESLVPSRNLLANREELVETTTTAVLQTLEQRDGEGIFVISGDAGTGQGAVARAVKWKTQLHGFHTVWLDFRNRDSLLSPIIQLLHQLAALPGPRNRAALTELSDHCEHMALHTLGQQVADHAVAAARNTPLLVICEQLNTAAPEALSVVKHLAARTSPGCPLMVLPTVSGWSWQDSLGPAAGIVIPPFNEEQVTRLLTRYLGDGAASGVEPVMAHTGGNPLLVVRTLEEAVATGRTLEAVASMGVADLEGQWQHDLDTLKTDEYDVVVAAAILERPSPGNTILTVANGSTDNNDLLQTLCDKGLLKQHLSDFAISSASLGQTVVARLSPDDLSRVSLRAFHAVGDLQQILHGARSGQEAYIADTGLPLLKKMEQQGSLSAADKYLEIIVEQCSRPDTLASARLIWARIRITRGDVEKATQILDGLHVTSPIHQQEVLCLRARIAIGKEQLDEAAALLEEALRVDGGKQNNGSATVLLGDVEFRRQRYDACIDACNRGLDFNAGPDVSANLMCSKARASSALGKNDAALVLTEQAIALGTQTGDRQATGFAMDIKAWILSLQGRLEEATHMQEQAASLYRETGNLPRLARSLQVLGNNYWWLEKWAQMLGNHEEAMRHAGSIENPVQRNELLITAGFSHSCVGRFEKAALILSRAHQEAERLNNRLQQLKATVYEGDLLAWQGHHKQALHQWKLGYDGFMLFSEFALCAELALEMAQAHIQLKTPSDLETARNLLQEASSHQRADLGRNFEHLKELTRGQLLLATGEFEQGVLCLDELIQILQSAGALDLQWQAQYAVAKALLDKGSDVLAKMRLRNARTILDQLAGGLPKEHRLAFWQDVRRADVKKLLALLVSRTTSDMELALEDGETHTGKEAEDLYRVLEFNKRISRETDIPLLTAAILDAAIELTGAERGFLLMPAEKGLEVRVAREMEQETINNPHSQFSRSIAESVFLDNEAIVTIDAANDQRFNEFLSIHHLQVKSVACVPVCYRNRPLGVVYLENRLTAGRFTGRDLRVLSAFGDQVAIALSHAAALEKLASSNEELQQAKTELELVVTNQSADLKTKNAGLQLAREQLDRIRARVEGEHDYFGLVGNGKGMKQVFALIERIKDKDIPVVITGASGTGKDAVAKVIHEAGRRKSEPFVAVPCGAIPESLVESMLFGHVKGAFSGADKDNQGIFASAGRGTVYLDNIGEMPPRMQVDLLRVLQEGTYTPLGSSRSIHAGFRLLCSSSEPLQKLVETGRLREDMYYRLQVVDIPLPSLDQRSEDLLLLLKLFVDREATRLGVPVPTLEASLAQQISHCSFPGNVRELELTVRRSLVVHGAVDCLTFDMLFSNQVPLAPAPSNRPNHTRSGDALKKEIIDALEACQWNKSKAAEQLGIPRRTFYRRLKALGIS